MLLLCAVVATPSSTVVWDAHQRQHEDIRAMYCLYVVQSSR
jgi:hypothetical protein